MLWCQITSVATMSISFQQQTGQLLTMACLFVGVQLIPILCRQSFSNTNRFLNHMVNFLQSLRKVKKSSSKQISYQNSNTSDKYCCWRKRQYMLKSSRNGELGKTLWYFTNLKQERQSFTCDVVVHHSVVYFDISMVINQVIFYITIIMCLIYQKNP